MKIYVRSSVSEEFEDELPQVPQEFTSKNTSINTAKVPAIFKLVSWTPNTINIDYGGGKADTATEYLATKDVKNLIYDPFNRSSEHNRSVIRECRAHGGADSATCSNVLNVIKEPEARKNVLKNLSKLVKAGGDIFITVYEGSGTGEGRQSQEDSFQLNRKTKDYLEEIQEVFPDATRKGKLIRATNSGAVNSSEAVVCTVEGLEEVKDMFEDGYQGPGWFQDEVKMSEGDGSRLRRYLEDLGYKVKKNLKERIWILPGECFWNDDTFFTYRPDPQLQTVAAADKVEAAKAPFQIKEGLKQLQDDLYNAASELMQSPEYGFPLEEIADYLIVEVEPIQDGKKTIGYKAEVRAELSYDGMLGLAQALNPIVEIIDEDAYFDNVTGGIIDAYMYFHDDDKKPIYESDDICAEDITCSVSQEDINKVMMRAVDVQNHDQLMDVLEDVLSIDQKLWQKACDMDQDGDSPATVGKMISNELYWKLEKINSACGTDKDEVEASYKTHHPNYCPHCTNMTLVEVEDGHFVCEECGEEFTGYTAFEGGLELTPIEESQEVNCSKKTYLVDVGGVETYEIEADSEEEALEIMKSEYLEPEDLEELEDDPHYLWIRPEDDVSEETQDEDIDASCHDVEAASKVQEDGWTRSYNSELEREEYYKDTRCAKAFIRGFDHDGEWGYQAYVDPIEGRRYRKSFYRKDSLEKAKKYCEEHLEMAKKYCEDHHVDASVEAASYGGAFDIEDDQYFTKEELVEFGNGLCDEFNTRVNIDLSPREWSLESIYMTPENKNCLEIEITDGDITLYAKAFIDMRKIRKPADINKYKEILLKDLRQGWDEYFNPEYEYPIESSCEINAYSDADYQEFLSLEEPIYQAMKASGGDLDDFQGDIRHSSYLSDFLILSFESYSEDNISENEFKKNVKRNIKAALKKTRWTDDIDVDIYKKFLSRDELKGRVPEDKVSHWFIISVTAYAKNDSGVEASQNILAYEHIDWDNPEEVHREYEVEFDSVVTLTEDSMDIPEDVTFDDLEDDEYDIRQVDDGDSVAEKIFDLVIDMMPEEPGKYRVSGIAHLKYDIDGLYHGYDDPDWDDVIPGSFWFSEDADIDYDYRGSYIENLQVEKVEE